MTNEEKEDCIDKLLIYMNDVVEKSDVPMYKMGFDFSKNSAENLAILGDFEKLKEIVSVCKTRNFIKQFPSLNSGKFGNLLLTEKGQERAISVQSKEPRQMENSQINLIINGDNNQFGNCNSQSKIETNGDASKSKINKIVSHPLFIAIVTGLFVVLAAFVGVYFKK